ncbi:hypothetical protein MNEG_9176 [Monoraphidium neglectum]|uniref:ABM domain-containing protein n=1 Tax=Monoraphidium neglectum TaxID=145388 RepID=A0A0D2MDF5_9CHLO|nr:hypothetical protein MNEG_9176 [Monoraphidium neglectum]KIY98786.1 hypothetical protein MNEG_9176 [Monoraphidium neglectum]|eukprot:XP_013897806.1 hypothetical protein MNEG_9176 [Monoraphidium neglectum]
MVFWVLGVYKVKDVEAAAASYETSRETRHAAGQKSYRVFKVTNAPEGEQKIAILGDWDDPAQFEAFCTTSEFKAIADGLQMLEPPQVTVLQELSAPH